MSFFQGKNSSMTWSATSQPMDKTDQDEKCEVIDTTNSLSSGFQSNLDGITSADLTSEGPYNGSIGLAAGNSTAFTFATGGGGPSFAITYRISSLRISTAVRNQVARWAMQATSNGVFTINL